MSPGLSFPIKLVIREFIKFPKRLDAAYPARRAIELINFALAVPRLFRTVIPAQWQPIPI
jgi:hypothetical protein